MFRIRKQLVFPELFQLRFIAWRVIFLASNKAYIKKKRQVLSLTISPILLEILQFQVCINFLAAFTHYYNTGSQILTAKVYYAKHSGIDGFQWLKRWF